MYGAVAGSANGGSAPPPAGSLPPNPLPPKAKVDEEAGKLLGNAQETGSISAGIFGKGSRRQDNGRLVTAFLVVNYMIGSGILNSPQTFRDSGLAATTLLYFIACPAVWLGAVVLIQAAEASALESGKNGGTGGSLEDLEYTAVAARTLGEYGPSLVDGSIVLQNFGSVCSYVILVGGLTTSIIGELSGGVTGAWWQSFYFVTPLIVSILVLPPCLVRHFSNLRWLAAFSLFAIAAVVCLVVGGSPLYADAERMTEVVESGLDAPLLWWNWTGSFAKMGSLMFAVTFAPAALHSYSAMGTRTVKEWRAVAGMSVFTGALLCYFTGLAGYVAFRSATEGDILDNFSGPVAGCFKVLVVVHLILYIPSEVVILRHSLFKLAGLDVMVVSFAAVTAVTVGVLALIVGVVIALMLAGMAQGDIFGYILDLTGGVTASLTGFIIPALAYLQATKGMVDRHDVDGKNVAAYRTGCKVLAVFGMIVMFMVPSAVVLNIMRK